MAVQQRTWLRAQLTLPKVSFFLLFWAFHIGVFALGWWIQSTDERLAALNTLTFSVWFSRGAGLCLSVDVTLLLLPMCRNLLTVIRPKLRWLPLDESTFFHRHVAYSLLFWTIVHTSAHCVNFFNVELTQIRRQAAVQIMYTEAGGITGNVMLLCMLLMFTTSHIKIRQQSFETFYYTHHLFIPFFLAMYTHATGCFVRDSTDPYSPFAGKPFWQHCLGYEGWRWELVVGGLYLGERIWRELRSRQQAEIVKVVKHPYDAVEIQFRKPSMRYKPGQWLFINIPTVSYSQWHPFTITSCPHDEYVSIHVRQVGDFTRDLASALGVGSEQQDIYEHLDPMGLYEVALQNGQQMPPIRIDGPYGAPAEDVLDNEVAILIGTGIGITPWASILKNVWHDRAHGYLRRLRRIEFIWVCRDTTSFEWFQALLSSLEAQSLDDTNGGGGGGQSDFLRIHTYLTQRMDADAAQNIVLNSVGTDRDPLTELSSRTNFGRPNFRNLLVAMRQGILNQSYLAGLATGKGSRTKVGVYFCGPNSAAGEIRKACKEATVPEVRFRFWKEHF